MDGCGSALRRGFHERPRERDEDALDTAGDHDADGALPVGKLRRLFAKDAKRGAGGSKSGRRP